MKSPHKIITEILGIFFLTLSTNCVWIVEKCGYSFIPVFVILFLLSVFLPLVSVQSLPKLKTKVCGYGVTLLKEFWWSAAVSFVYHIVAAFFLFPENWSVWVISAVVCICANAVVFWIGIICVYCTSLQLGIKHRVIGIACGFIPIANLISLRDIIKTVSAEVEYDVKKSELNTKRSTEKICSTKYPVLLVHGVFFRDFKYINYWGRIPSELKRNGAEIFYGNHQSAASVSDSAEELTQRIKEIIQKTGCEKVNIVAHSKGGLDCRYAISNCGASEYVASLTTINTPHRGCEFADYLLEKIPTAAQEKVALAYNAALKKLGDKTPDFMAAVRDLTAKGCSEINEKTPDAQGVYYQSIGSVQNRATSGKFPLNFTYHLVKYFDGPNDGLVSEPSFRWGNNYSLLKVKGKRGISHGDMIDLNKENIPDFDVLEFYVQLLAELKQKGY